MYVRVSSTCRPVLVEHRCIVRLYSCLRPSLSFCLFIWLLVVGQLGIFVLCEVFSSFLLRFKKKATVTESGDKSQKVAFVRSGKIQQLLLPLRRDSPTIFLLLPPYTSRTDRYGLIHQARISASVNAMRVLNTGTEVEAAVADALVRCWRLVFQ